MREGQRLLQLVGSSAEGTQLAERLLSSSLAGTSGTPVLRHSDPFTSFRAVVRAYSSLVRRQAAQVAQQSPHVFQQQGTSDSKVNKFFSSVTPLLTFSHVSTSACTQVRDSMAFLMG